MTTDTAKHADSFFSLKTYRWAGVVLNLTGLFAALYLVRSHYRNFTDMGYQSFCAISRALNCDTVSQSPHAIFLDLPIAVWGALGYALFLILLVWLWVEEKPFCEMALLSFLAALFSSVSIALALVSSFWVKSYCLICMLTYAVNFLLLLLTWIAQRRFGGGSLFADLKATVQWWFKKPIRLAGIAIAVVAMVTSLYVYYPKYWHFSITSANLELHHGVTQDQAPYLGAEDPVLTIVEFADYMCFQCAKMHHHLRRLVAQYPDKIRLVHRQFPLDHLVNPLVKEPLHHQTSLVSLLAIYAVEQNKFWQVNDILFRKARETGSFDFTAISKEAGLDLSHFKDALNSGKLMGQLAADIRAGLKNGVTATPSYLIDGKLYSGVIPEDVFDPVLKAGH